MAFLWITVRGEFVDIDLVETLKLITERFNGRTQGSVFIPMNEFPWYNERNGQLTRLKEMGLISNLRFEDNGAVIGLTQKGRRFFDERERMTSLNKDKMFEILQALTVEMKIPEGNFGFEPGPCRGAIKQLQEQGYIAGVKFAEGGWDPNPRMMWIERGYVTAKGIQLIEDYLKQDINLTEEFISACAKIADNPASYTGFDEDGLNREIRNFLDSAISRFGYTIADQTQQGLGETSKRAGELDIRISKNGIPVAIFEGLIHKDKKYFYGHIQKAISQYNGSGCKSVYVVEYSKNKGFGHFWDNAYDLLNECANVDNVSEENTGLLGVKMLKGTFVWEGQQGAFYYIGVNCYYRN